VAKPPPGEMIELHFRHQPGAEGLPLRGAVVAPSTRPSRALARETGGLDQLL
jgi:hypothetical protein